jgi:hypothetical protein
MNNNFDGGNREANNSCTVMMDDGDALGTTGASRATNGVEFDANATGSSMAVMDDP